MATVYKVDTPGEKLEGFPESLHALRSIFADCKSYSIAHNQMNDNVNIVVWHKSGDPSVVSISRSDMVCLSDKSPCSITEFMEKLPNMLRK